MKRGAPKAAADEGRKAPKGSESASPSKKVAEKEKELTGKEAWKAYAGELDRIGEANKGSTILPGLKRIPKSAPMSFFRNLTPILIPETAVKAEKKFREKIMKEMGGDHGFMMFTTSSSYHFHTAGNKELAKIEKDIKANQLPRAFDNLYALHSTFYDFDNWLVDTDVPEESGMLVTRIGKAWKELLKHDPKDFGCVPEHCKSADLKWYASFLRKKATEISKGITGDDDIFSIGASWPFALETRPVEEVSEGDDEDDEDDDEDDEGEDDEDEDDDDEDDE